MRILIVTNHFWPENFRITDLALGLKERGHEVSVLTGVPDYPQGKFYDGYGIFKRRLDEYQGVKISRFPLIPRGEGKPLNLALNYLSSALFSCLCAPFYCKGRFDVIFVFDTSPVTIGLSAILLKKLKSIPMVFWILDLWPESLSATGAVRSPTILHLVRKLVRYIYRQCDLILVSSGGFTQSIHETGGYERDIVYFPNWVEPEYFSPAESSLPFDVSKMPDGFRIMFAGNIGAAQDFETVLTAAEILSSYQDIHWVIFGDGRLAEWVRNEVQKRKLGSCFHLLGRYPAEMMPCFFTFADAMLMPLKRDPIFALTVPGKLQSYMACGKPVIAALDGEGARLVRDADAGVVCPAESPVELAEQVLALYRMSLGERQRLGENGRQYCQEHFDRLKQFGALEKMMEGLVRVDSSNVSCTGVD